MKRRKSNQDKKRKEERKLEKKYLEEADSSKTHWFILIGFILFFVLFYVITLQVTDKKTKDTSTNVEEGTGEILLGSSFNMNSEEYFVLYYDSTDTSVSSTCSSLFQNYRDNNGEKSIYYVDMNSGFNRSYVTEEETNKSVENVSDLRINGPTLIKIQQGTIAEYIEGLDSIEETLG